MKSQRISSAVIHRLPRYYRHLTDLANAGVVRISSSALGKNMNLTASQIRQDLSCFGEFGQQGYGYNVESLRSEVADILGMTQGHTAVILGAGNLGRALIENFHFKDIGFQLSAAFDIDPKLIGQKISGIDIYSIDYLEEYLASHPTSVGILTVPHTDAISMSQRLAACGVKGIWNFTNCEITMALGDSGVIVENIHFSDSLLTLSYLISEAP